jgi:dUTP pyrophosphatase
MINEEEENLGDLLNQLENLQELEDMFGDEEPDYQNIMDIFGVDISELERDMANFEQKMKVEYSQSSVDSIDPSYAYPTDSGFDLFSTEEIEIESFGRSLIPTGLHIDIPDGYEVQVRSKSGLALKQGLMVLNSPGTVDCFSENMKILTIDGDKTIKELRIGDIVYSFNEDSLEIEKDVISSIFDTGVQEILLIDTEHGILEVTPNSEVYTKDGIKLAKNLTETDEIITF